MKTETWSLSPLLRRLWSAFEKVILSVTVVALWAIVGLVVTKVGLRYLFGIGLPWSDELARFLHIAIVFIALAYVFRTNAHIGVDFVFHKLPIALKKFVHAWNLLLQIALSAAVVIGAIRVFQDLWAVRSPALRMPTGLFFFPTVFGFALLGLVLVVYLIRFLVHGDDDAIAEQAFEDEEGEVSGTT